MRKVITNHIASRHPTHHFLTEESSPTVSDRRIFSEPYWIIDPIDGTTSYAHGLPHTASSIAFMNNGEVQVGVVYAPFLNDLFVGVKGQGATRNGHTIRVCENAEFSKSLIAIGFPTKRDTLPGPPLSSATGSV